MISALLRHFSMRRAAYTFVCSYLRSHTTVMPWRVALAWRLPPRLRQRLMVWPELAGKELTPQREDKAVSQRSRSGWSRQEDMVFDDREKDLDLVLARIDSRFCGAWAPVRGFLVGPDPLATALVPLAPVGLSLTGGNTSAPMGLPFAPPACHRAASAGLLALAGCILLGDPASLHRGSVVASVLRGGCLRPLLGGGRSGTFRAYRPGRTRTGPHSGVRSLP